jgi:hypothetical protein
LVNQSKNHHYIFKGLFELIVLAVGLYFFREKLNNKDLDLIVFATIDGFLRLF